MAIVEARVSAVRDVGPRIRRVVFDVPRLADLGLPGAADEAVGIYFSDAPEGRNYSVRRRDGHQLTCDVVLHPRGLATDWARGAAVGDAVGLDHARSWYRPEPATRWQLLVADLAGLPALARILTETPRDAAATVIVEVAEEADLDYLPARSDVTVIGSIGTGNGLAGSRLPELVRAHRHPGGRGYCWLAGEARAAREVRKHLRGDHGWASDQYDVVGYWRFDSESWDRRFEPVSAEMAAVYERALAEGQGDKDALEAFDRALERVGL